MIGETRDGQPVRAWIFQPQHDRAYVAERGAGAWLNGEPLVSPSRTDDPHGWRGVTSRRSWIGREVDGLRPLELTWVCCGVDYPKLIEGAADFIVYGRGNPWDHVPGSLLLAESGGYLGLLDGRHYDARRVADAGILAAADRATYDTVVSALPH